MVSSHVPLHQSNELSLTYQPLRNHWRFQQLGYAGAWVGVFQRRVSRKVALAPYNRRGKQLGRYAYTTGSCGLLLVFNVLRLALYVPTIEA